MYKDKLILVIGGASYATPFEHLGVITFDPNELSGADLVVFTGGHDVSPSLYGEKPHFSTHSNIDRDTYEASVYNKALFHKIPMVGICRGLQFIHVMNGGKLNQDIIGHPNANYSMGAAHLVITSTGESFTTNTLHHQACLPAKIAMEVLATTVKDKSIEAVFYQETNCFGVQWHPEMLPSEHRGRTWFQERVLELLGENTSQKEFIYADASGC